MVKRPYHNNGLLKELTTNLLARAKIRALVVALDIAMFQSSIAHRRYFHPTLSSRTVLRTSIRAGLRWDPSFQTAS